VYSVDSFFPGPPVPYITKVGMEKYLQFHFFPRLNWKTYFSIGYYTCKIVFQFSYFGDIKSHWLIFLGYSSFPFSRDQTRSAFFVSLPISPRVIVLGWHLVLATKILPALRSQHLSWISRFCDEFGPSGPCGGTLSECSTLPWTTSQYSPFFLIFFRITPEDLTIKIWTQDRVWKVDPGIQYNVKNPI
jgi:hypothetical protein